MSGPTTHPGEQAAEGLGRAADASGGPASWFGGLFEQMAAAVAAQQAARHVAGQAQQVGANMAPVYCVFSSDARLRDPANNLDAFQPIQRVPRWTRVHILEERDRNGRPTVRVEDLQGNELGWIDRASNLRYYHQDQPGLQQADLAPPADRQIQQNQLPDPDSNLQQAMMRLWNRLGGLMQTLSDAADIQPELMIAILYKESGGAAHQVDNMLVRLEAHVLRRQWEAIDEDAHPYSDATFDDHWRYCGRGVAVGDNHGCGECRADADGDPKVWLSQQVRFPAERPGEARQWECVSSGVGRNRRHEIIDLAADLAGTTAAYRSISMGTAQIMGFNHEVIGYETVEQMYDRFQADERWHLLGAFDFLHYHNEAGYQAAQGDNPDVETVGEGYNGSADYGDDLRDKYDVAEDVLGVLP